MPWFWSSSASSPTEATKLSPDSMPSTPEYPAPNRPVSPPTEASSQDDQDAAVLGQFMPIFANSDTSSSKNPLQPSARDAIRHQLQAKHESDEKEDTPLTSIAAFPDSMSCRQAFDDAFYCQSLGGQFMNVYRYGTLRSCSDHWSQFWFCMRTRGKAEETKKREIQEFYRKKEEKYISGPSSEDVWEARTVRVESAFQWDPDEAGILEKRREG